MRLRAGSRDPMKTIRWAPTAAAVAALCVVWAAFGLGVVNANAAVTAEMSMVQAEHPPLQAASPDPAVTGDVTGDSPASESWGGTIAGVVLALLILVVGAISVMVVIRRADAAPLQPPNRGR